MKLRKNLNYLLCIAVSVFVLAGCEKNKTDDISIQESEVQQNQETSQSSTMQQEETTSQTSMEQEEESSQTSTEQEEPSVFEVMSNLEFCFSSGAGGWGTVMNIHEDGTFEGEYHDSDMGDIGEGYPNGVVYLCNFNGKFTQPQKMSEYTYSMKIEYIENKNVSGTEEIIDGVCYRYSDPYGLDSAEDIYIYLPGSPLQELPEGFLSWIGYSDLENTSDTRLPYYGLYNVTPEYGFSSYVATGTEENIDAELAVIEAEATVLENELQSGMLNQMQLNQTSAELYQLWDDELNAIWSRLKEKLDASAMAALTEEERAWITEKEREIEAVGAEYGAGTMRPLAENDKAAEMTRDRVYELAELLR